MSKELTLPSGATVVLRDAKTLKVKDRNKVYEAASNGEGIMQAIGLIDGLIAILIESWSFDLILPSIKIETLGELDIGDYDALQKETEETQKIIFPALAKTVEAEQDPKAPTANSKD